MRIFLKKGKKKKKKSKRRNKFSLDVVMRTQMCRDMGRAVKSALIFVQILVLHTARATHPAQHPPRTRASHVHLRGRPDGGRQTAGPAQPPTRGRGRGAAVRTSKPDSDAHGHHGRLKATTSEDGSPTRTTPPGKGGGREAGLLCASRARRVEVGGAVPAASGPAGQPPPGRRTAGSHGRLQTRPSFIDVGSLIAV